MKLWKVRALPRHGVQLSRRWLLRRRYKFDSWHMTATPAARPYKQAAAELIASTGASSVVDVGCGLGDLGGLLPKTVDYVGLDIRESVVAAASRLHPDRTFRVGSFAEAVGIEGEVLVAVNWINTIAPDDLSDLLGLAAGASRYLLIDAVDQRRDSYDHRGLRVAGFQVKRTVTGPHLDRTLVLHQRMGESDFTSASAPPPRNPGSRSHVGPEPHRSTPQNTDASR